MHKHVIGWTVVLSLGFGTQALAADAMTREAYQSAKDKIEDQARADKKACEPMKANAKDICQAEAKAKEKVAKAELDAQNRPGARADEKVKLTRVEADYEIAKEKCEDQQGAAIATCKKDAKAAKDKATAEVRAAQKTDAKKKS